MILIGSRALLLRAPQLLIRKPQDFDFVCTINEFDKWLEENSHILSPCEIYPQTSGNFSKMIVESLADGSTSNCEFEIIQANKSSSLLAQIIKDDPDTLETSFGLVPSIDMLFTIKASHKYLKNSPHFWKTLADYHILKRAGAKIRPEYQDFFRMREKETYYYKHPKLNQSKDNFFADDNIKYVYDHDTIHQSVARFDGIPAYTRYMKDGEEVQCDKDKFFACPREVQLAGVVEEAAVLAIERSLVPHHGVWTPQYAWRFALSKVCSSITSGWFREFAYENALDVLKLYPEGYWEKFQKDVESGLVKKL